MAPLISTQMTPVLWDCTHVVCNPIYETGMKIVMPASFGFKVDGVLEGTSCLLLGKGAKYWLDVEKV